MPWTRLRQATASLGLALTILATTAPLLPVWAKPAAADAPSTTTTTAPPTTTTTTTVSTTPTPVSGGSPTTTSVLLGSTTTTTPPPGAGNIPPPPAPPLPPRTATAAQLAQATALEGQIAAQSTVLDRLADRFNRAHLDAVAAAQRLPATQAQEATAQAKVALAGADITSADRSLHRTALDAYLDVKLLPNTGNATMSTQAYQLAIAKAYSGSAAETATQRVRDVHAAERHLRDVEHQVAAAAKLATVDAAARLAADQRVHMAADLAAAQQAKLVATLGKCRETLLV